MQYSIFLKIYLTPHSGKNDSYNTHPLFKIKIFLPSPTDIFQKFLTSPAMWKGAKCLPCKALPNLVQLVC